MSLFTQVGVSTEPRLHTDALSSEERRQQAYQSVLEYAQVISQRHTTLGLGGGKWSLAEIGSDDDDYTLLCQRITHLPRTALLACLNNSPEAPRVNFYGAAVSARATLGILILLICAESARRYANEGEIWPAAVRPFDGSAAGAQFLRNRLFLQGQPTYDFKTLVRETVTCFNLRHVLPPQILEPEYSCDDAETASAEKRKWWFQTLKLQYGLSARVAISDRLSHYLADGTGPDAVRWLLYGLPGTETDFQADSRSDSFRRFFSDLQKFRHGDIDAAELHDRLERSPWSPRVESKKLEKAARRRRPTSNRDSLLEAMLLVSDLRLVWDGQASSQPMLRFRLESEVLNRVTEDAVCITVNGDEVGRAFRQSGGQMFAVPSCTSGVANTAGAFQLLFTGESELTVRLESCDTNSSETVFYAETVFIYQPADEVNAFSNEGHPTGGRISARQRPSLLLLGEGLRLGTLGPQTNAAVSQPFFPCWPLGEKGTLYWVPSGLTAALYAFFPELPEEPIPISGWGNTYEAREDETPEWAKPCRYALEFLPDDPRIGLRLELPDDVEPVRVRMAGQTSLAPGANGLWGTLSGATAPDALQAYVWLAHQGKTVRVRTPVLPTKRAGRAFYRASDALGGWALCSAEDCLSTKALSGGAALRVFARKDWTCEPEDYDAPKGCLFEGTRLLGRIPLDRSRLQGTKFSPAGGWGNRLTVRCRRFNDADLPITLACAVVDFGILKSIVVEPETVTLELDQHRTKTDHICVHVWDDTGQMTTYPSECVTVISSCEWQVPALPEGRAIGIVAVSARGIRMGAYPLPDFARVLLPDDMDGKKKVEGPDGATLAAWLRWLRLPLVRDDLRPVVREWLRTAGGAGAVWAWARNTSLPAGFHDDPRAEVGWLTALRRLLGKVTPTGVQAHELLNLLAPASAPLGKGPRVVDKRDEPQRVGRALAELADISPDFARAVLVAYWCEHLGGFQREAGRARLIQEAYCSVWETRFQELLRRENERRDPWMEVSETLISTPKTVTALDDQRILAALANALHVDVTFLTTAIALTSNQGNARLSPAEANRRKANRDTALEINSELRALTFWHALKDVTRPTNPPAKQF